MLNSVKPYTPMSDSRRRKVPIICAGVILAALGLGAAAPSEARAADSPFTVTNGTVRATTLAGNLNGTEAVLKGNSSAASQTISGKGPMVLMARGTSCKGKAKVRVYVNNKKVKDISLSAAKKFSRYTVKSYADDAARTVKVRLINNKATKKCNRDAFVTGSYMTNAVTTNPAATTYGVPSGTKLRIVNGDMTITAAGTTLDGVDLHGYLTIKANNVTIRNSILRGGATATSTKALIMAWAKPKNLQVINSTLKADNPSLHVDGLSGSGYTADGLDISGVVDATKVIGGNVTIRNSWFHDPIHSASDPNQPDGKTHDDGIQIEGGSAILVENNKIGGFHNAAIQVTQNYAATHGVTVRNNEFSGGACQINVTDKGAGGGGKAISSFSLTSNGFGPGDYGTTCPMRLPNSSSFSVSANYWIANGKPAVPNRF
jgi:hypothetical protein